MKNFIIDLLKKNQGLSSKRFCGIIAWFVILGIFIYATITEKTVPSIAEYLMICSAALLGVDSITNIFDKNL